MLKKFRQFFPSVDSSSYVAEQALLIGRVYVKRNASVWPGSILRGDVEEIMVEEAANIQDGTVVHTNYDMPVHVGSRTTIGHGVNLHGCRIGACCMVGIGAVILDGTVLGDYTIIGAGSVVPEGKELEGGYLYMGVPAKKKRELTPSDRKIIDVRATEYVKLSGEYK